ncbi:MAG TPA: amidohydrolase family protein [Chloroflexota bacterium]|nr:amidohydrolase family protein [Chloroflexota bacterium]
MSAGTVPGGVWEAVLAGRPELAGVSLVDAHAHIGPWYNFRIARPYADGMLRTMDACGLHEAWITADASIGPDFRLGNALVAAAVRDHPDRFRGYVTVNPHEPAASADEVRRYYDQGWRLVKFHTGTHEHPADGPGYRPVWEVAARLGLHVLSHSFPSAPALAALAAAYPTCTLQMAHAATSPLALAPYYEVCAAHPNVYLDVCGSVLWRGLLEAMVAGAGADRILFGTDIPFIDPRPQIGRVAYARLPAATLRDVFGGNARRIWRRFGLPNGAPTTEPAAPSS